MIESYANPTSLESNSTLVIKLNEEYKIKIENGNYFKASIFKDVYLAALKNVEEIVSQSFKENCYDDFNNIIAFTGERGKGKSSSMISFRDALIEKDGDKHKEFFSKESLITNKKFATIDIIDPSLFRGGESLFEIILAQMFQKFQESIRCQESRINDDDRRTIIKQFQEVFENLLIINSDRKDLYKKESIEVLSRLATSSNLRKCFKELVLIYLKKFESGKDFLVIAIDDFDLNFSESYNMLEDIRQFFIQSKIIILIACKVEQLKETIEWYYKDQKIESKVEIKSKRYLDKILPLSRRIDLPDVRNLTQKDFRILDNNMTVFETKNSNFKTNISKLLFDKLELFQPLDQLRQNLVIPETIRQTQNFVNLIVSDNSIENLIKYVVDESNNSVLKDFISELETVSDNIFLLVLSKKIAKAIRKKSSAMEVPKSRERVFLNDNISFIDSATISYRISIGDINFLLRRYWSVFPIDDYEAYSSTSLLNFYISLRIKRLLKNDRKALKYGFSSEYIQILPKENNTFSRDSISFSNSINEKLIHLENNDKIFFSLWIQNLGDGYRYYRRSLAHDIYVDTYKSGKLSPSALLHNIYNLNELSSYIGFTTENDLSNELKRWFDESIFIKQLSNPSFYFTLTDYIRLFSLQVKGSLPTNYFDTVSLLFTYAILYSLDRIETESNISGLVSDYLNNIIFKTMLCNFDTEQHSYKITNDLSKKYNLKRDTDFISYFSDKVVDVINYVYESSNVERSTISPQENIKSKENYDTLSNLMWHLENTKITSRLVGNRINILRNNKFLNDANFNKIKKLSYGLNKAATYENTKNELIKIVNNLMYG